MHTPIIFFLFTLVLHKIHSILFLIPFYTFSANFLTHSYYFPFHSLYFPFSLMSSTIMHSLLMSLSLFLTLNSPVKLIFHFLLTYIQIALQTIFYTSHKHLISIAEYQRHPLLLLKSSLVILPEADLILLVCSN